MIRGMGQRQRFDAFMEDDADVSPLKDVLGYGGTSRTLDTQPPPMTDKEQGQFFKSNTVRLERDEYDGLLRYLHVTNRPHLSVYADNDEVGPWDCLSPVVHKLPTTKFTGDRVFSCRENHVGNSAIRYRNSVTNRLDTGFIEEIWELPLDGQLRTFFIVQPNRTLEDEDEKLAPFHEFHDKYAVRIYDATQTDTKIIIESHHIQTHCATLERPPGTYGIACPTLIVSWAPNRGRR